MTEVGVGVGVGVGILFPVIFSGCPPARPP